MQEQHLFEYAVIRVVPRVERGEFLNVGVIVYCAARRYLECRYLLRPERLQAFSADLDLPELEARLQAFGQVCKGGKEGGPIGALPIASRFRWLTATRSTVVQTSPVHPGFCTEGEEVLERLFGELVL